MKSQDKRLKVNPLFYRSFSRYLQRESLKHMGGINEVTRKVADKIKNTKLNSRDIAILVGFNCSTIIRSIMDNKLVPVRVKYKMIVTHNLYKEADRFLDVLPMLIEKSNQAKARRLLLKQWDKCYREKPGVFDGDPDIFEDLVDEKLISNLPELPVVDYVVTRGWLEEDRTYSYQSWSYEDLIGTRNPQNIIAHLRLFLQSDIKQRGYHYNTLVLRKLNALVQHNKPGIDKLKAILYYMIEDVLPKIYYKNSDSSGGYNRRDNGSIDEFLKEIIRALTLGILSGEEIGKIVNSLNVSEIESDSVATFLIKMIQKS